MHIQKSHQKVNITYLWIMQLWVIFFSAFLCVYQIFYSDKVLFLKIWKKTYLKKKHYKIWVKL
jgi:hypothetical protein